MKINEEFHYCNICKMHAMEVITKRQNNVNANMDHLV